jgi:hypothetical protein
MTAYMTPYAKYTEDMRFAVIDDRMSMMDLGMALFGECIGTGDTRRVFNYALDDSMVIKYEPGPTHNNSLEFNIWTDLMENNSPLKSWFAPARFLSPCGRFLWMSKTSKVLNWPDSVPRALHDLHVGNFGMLGGRFVCHDYANLPLLSDPQGTRMKSVKWRVNFAT